MELLIVCADTGKGIWDGLYGSVFGFHSLLQSTYKGRFRGYWQSQQLSCNGSQYSETEKEKHHLIQCFESPGPTRYPASPNENKNNHGKVS